MRPGEKKLERGKYEPQANNVVGERVHLAVQKPNLLFDLNVLGGSKII